MAWGMKSKVDGDTETFSSGAKRSAMRVRFDLVSPVGLRRVAERAKMGADKFGAYNIESGLPVSVLLNHALNHIYAYLAGDRDEDQLGAAAWNLLFACHSEELWPDLNTDLRAKGCKPPKIQKEEAE